MRKYLKRIAKDQSGATAIEYGLIAAFIGIAIIAVLKNVGIELSTIFVDVEAGLKMRT
ncbi:MAG: Flp family type IVb pilin [Hyphomicrobiaceae bacterium]